MTTVRSLRLAGSDAHDAFMVLLHTLAEPGDLGALRPGVLPDDVPAAAVLPLAIADVDVTVHVQGDDELAARIREATLSPAAPIEDAAIVVLVDARPEHLRAARRGVADAPEAGARVAIAVERLMPLGAVQAATGSVPEGSTVLRLQGPGVPDVRWVAVTGLALGVVEALTEANDAFPAGIDVWLADRTGRVLGLPRSCTVTVDLADHEPADHEPADHEPDQADQEDR